MSKATTKLRILCLHGFTSNGAVHSYQVRHITSKLSNDYQFIFPDGPHEVDISKSMGTGPTTKAWSEFVKENSEVGHRAWWFAKDPDASKNEPGGFKGLEKSLDYLSTVIEKTGPVDAIWGFSQGACFAGMLMSLLHPSMASHPLRQRLPALQGLPLAGIFFSGFKARFPQYDSIYEYRIKVPTLHILGKEDKIVDHERSEGLINVCENALMLPHKGGHEIPDGEEELEKIVEFVRMNVR